MSLIRTLKDMFVPETEHGVVIRCTDCGATFEESHAHCPECGSTDVKEEEGFDMRPNE